MKQPDTRYWDSVALTCESDESTSNRLWRSHSDALNVDLVARWVRNGRFRRVLKTDLFDEVLGGGLYPFLRERAGTFVGVDVSAVMVRKARGRHGVMPAVAGDVRRLPFADQSFDLIVSDSTLDHFERFEELAQALREVHRVLRSGGQLVMTLDNLYNPVVAVRNALPIRLLRRIGIVPYFVGVTYGPRRLRRVLESTGFEIRELDAIVHAPRVLAIPAARLVSRHGSRRLQERYSRALMAFESMAKWPTRFVSGHFIAVSAFRV